MLFGSSIVHSIFVFDAYGTLFDTGAAVARHAAELGAASDKLAEVWRRKQLEYSWVRTLMGDGARDFWTLTEEALDYALATLPAANPALRARLLEAYRDLDAFAEVPEALRKLKERGTRLAILSNGSHEMLVRAARAARIDHLLDDIFSAEDVRRYKTATEVYELVTTAYRVYPDAVSFQSSNRWDIAGATRFGFRTVWINRNEAPDEYQDLPPALVLPDLAGLASRA